MTTIPVPVTGITQNTKLTASISLTWAPVTGATSYNTQYTWGPGKVWVYGPTVKTNAATIVALNPGTTYLFRVFANK